MDYLWEILRYVAAWGGTDSDHLVLVLDVLQHRHVLIGRFDRERVSDRNDRPVGRPRDSARTQLCGDGGRAQ